MTPPESKNKPKAKFGLPEAVLAISLLTVGVGAAVHEGSKKNNIQQAEPTTVEVEKEAKAVDDYFTKMGNSGFRVESILSQTRDNISLNLLRLNLKPGEKVQAFRINVGSADPKAINDTILAFSLDSTVDTVSFSTVRLYSDGDKELIKDFNAQDRVTINSLFPDSVKPAAFEIYYKVKAPNP